MLLLVILDSTYNYYFFPSDICVPATNLSSIVAIFADIGVLPQPHYILRGGPSNIINIPLNDEPIMHFNIQHSRPIL